MAFNRNASNVVDILTFYTTFFNRFNSTVASKQYKNLFKNYFFFNKTYNSITFKNLVETLPTFDNWFGFYEETLPIISKELLIDVNEIFYTLGNILTLAADTDKRLCISAQLLLTLKTQAVDETLTISKVQKSSVILKDELQEVLMLRKSKTANSAAIVTGSIKNFNSVTKNIIYTFHTLYKFLEHYTGRSVSIYLSHDVELHENHILRIVVYRISLRFSSEIRVLNLNLFEFLCILNYAIYAQDPIILLNYFEFVYRSVIYYRYDALLYMIRYLMQVLLSWFSTAYNLRGFKLIMSGKFGRALNVRARVERIIIGKTSAGLRNVKIMQEFKTISSASGAFGIFLSFYYY